MSTLFEPIRNKFFRRIEKDIDFFSYYGIDVSEAMSLANEQANSYLIEALEKLTENCTPDIDFLDYDDSLLIINEDLTKREQGLIASLMYEVYFERDLVLLKAFKVSFTPSDLNQFSPSAERRTFTEMVDGIKLENMNKISDYAAKDRITGQPKLIKYDSYEY